MERIRNSTNVRKIAVTAMFLTIAIVINRFRIIIPIGGAPVVRIGFGGPFLQFIAVLFGPLYGGIAYTLNDVIGFLLNPQGGYLFPLTMTEFAKGFAIGFIWQQLKNMKFRTFNIAYNIFFIFIGILGLIDFIAMAYFENSAYAQFLMSIGKKSAYTSIGLLVTSAIGLLTSSLGFFSNHMMQKVNTDKEKSWFYIDAFFEKFLKMTVVIGIPNIIVTLVNTIILQRFMLLGDRAFVFLLIPRIIETLIITVINIYVLVLIQKIYTKTLAGRIDLEEAKTDI